MNRVRPVLLALAAGLALADASVVTLALPELLSQLDTTVEGVAGVLVVYTVVLAAALVPAEALQRRAGPATVGGAGALAFSAGCLVAGLANSLEVLLAGRAVQAAGGAGLLVSAFAVLVGGADASRGRRLWLGAAVIATAAGPALGGALTEAFSWRAIFYAQVPVALIAAVLSFAGRVSPAEAPTSVSAGARSRMSPGPAVALALLSAALTAVLFLLVLLVVAGWNVSPLRAALAVTVIPAAALIGSRAGGDARLRASLGCALVGAGVLALGFLPDASLWWTVAPQAAAGAGMGLALPALAGELLPERDPADAARLLTVRHAGIALALVALAPVVSSNLDDATQRARERGVALVLDAELPPLDKIRLAPDLLSGVEDQEPRKGLRAALQSRKADFEGDEAPAYATLSRRADETLVTAVGDAFRTAFLITGALALLGAVAVFPRRSRLVAAAAGAVALAMPAGYVLARDRLAPEPVEIRDPCEDRPVPSTGGIGGFLQVQALKLLDKAACRLDASREELVLALFDEDDAKRFEERHGTNPRTVNGLLGGLIGG
jgi:MFS family permease